MSGSSILQALKFYLVAVSSGMLELPVPRYSMSDKSNSQINEDFSYNFYM